MPFADPDTYGYLNSGLTWMRSGVFEQTHARSLLYPLFVAGLLKTTGSFSAIPLCQHLLGVSSGLLWWMLWRGGIRWLPPGFCRAWLAPLIGLAGLAVYLFGAEAIFFEHSLRPESIFPFFALAHLAAALFKCMRWILEGDEYGVPLLKAGAWALGPIILRIPFLTLCCARRFPDLRRFLGLACVGLAFSLGAALTVAIVHSFSIEGYSAGFVFLHSLLLAFGALLGGTLLERIGTWAGRGLAPRLHQQSPPAGGADRQ